MDFPLQRTLVEALNSEEKWDSGLNLLYEALANDFYYPRPMDIMLFGDNHDMDRLFTQLGESPLKMEMALAYIAVAPRIPQFYYGTEILMENSAKPGDHGLIRTDFPGGWKGDKKNAFSGKGLSEEALGMQQFLKRILQYRKTSKALTKGQTLHFAPEDGFYVLIRQFEEETVLLVLNKNEDPVRMQSDRFVESGVTGRDLENLITGEVVTWDTEIVLPKAGAYIWVVK